MKINLLLEEFDGLSDSEAIVISFKSLNPFIVDNDDILRVDDDSLQIKSIAGNAVVNIEEINGFQVLGKSDVVRKVLTAMCGD